MSNIEIIYMRSGRLSDSRSDAGFPMRREGDGTAGMRGETYVLADASLREELEQLELAEGAEAEHRVVERRDALDRHPPLARNMHRRPASSASARLSFL